MSLTSSVDEVRVRTISTVVGSLKLWLKATGLHHGNEVNDVLHLINNGRIITSHMFEDAVVLSPFWQAYQSTSGKFLHLLHTGGVMRRKARSSQGKAGSQSADYLGGDSFFLFRSFKARWLHHSGFVSLVSKCNPVHIRTLSTIVKVLELWLKATVLYRGDELSDAPYIIKLSKGTYIAHI